MYSLYKVTLSFCGHHVTFNSFIISIDATAISRYGA